MRSAALLVLALSLVARAEEAPGPERLSFAQAIARALERNPSAQVAAADVARSAALVDQSRAAWMPQVNLNAAVTRLDGDRKVGDRVFVPATSANGNLQAVVPLVAAQKWAQTTRVEDGLAVTRAGAADVRRQVALAAGRAYLVVLAQRRLVEVALLAVDTAREHAAYAHDRAVGGVGNKLDELRAAQELASSKAQLAGAEGGLSRAREALGLVVGTEGPVDAADEPKLEPPTTLAPVLDEAKEKRTDLAALQARVKTTERALGDAWADYLPLVSLVAQPFFQAPATATQPSLGWQAQLVLSLPLYDGGLRAAQQAERVALASSAKAQLDALQRQASSEVRAAFEAVRHADDGLAASRDAATVSQTTLEMAESAFRAGATTSLEVVDAQQRARQAAAAAVIAEDQSRQARLELLAAGGRFP